MLGCCQYFPALCQALSLRRTLPWNCLGQQHPIKAVSHSVLQ